MKAEIAAENMVSAGQGTDGGSILVAGKGDNDSDAGGESDASNKFIAEEVVGRVWGNKSRKYIVRWLGYHADDTINGPAQKFGTVLPFELLVNYLINSASVKQGHPGHVGALQRLTNKLIS